ncbi:hypothetical protein LXL04_036080 [Taraxacum kok-saghyz]
MEFRETDVHDHRRSRQRRTRNRDGAVQQLPRFQSIFRINQSVWQGDIACGGIQSYYPGHSSKHEYRNYNFLSSINGGRKSAAPAEVVVVSDVPEAEKVETCAKEAMLPEPVKAVAVEDEKEKLRSSARRHTVTGSQLCRRRCLHKSASLRVCGYRSSVFTASLRQPIPPQLLQSSVSTTASELLQSSVFTVVRSAA